MGDLGGEPLAIGTQNNLCVYSSLGEKKGLLFNSTYPPRYRLNVMAIAPNHTESIAITFS